MLCFHSKLLLCHAPVPDRALIVQGGDGAYVQKLFPVNINLAAQGWSFSLQIQIAPGILLSFEAHGSSTVGFQPAEELKWEGERKTQPLAQSNKMKQG